MSLGDIIFSGVFERHPKLRVGVVEFELSWIPHFLERIDYTYTQRGNFGVDKPPLREGMLPSDYFHQNVFAGFQEDSLGIRLRDVIGVDNIMWGSDYPHTEGTFPKEPADSRGDSGGLHRGGKSQDRRRQCRQDIQPELESDTRTGPTFALFNRYSLGSTCCFLTPGKQRELVGSAGLEPAASCV